MNQLRNPPAAVIALRALRSIVNEDPADRVLRDWQVEANEYLDRLDERELAELKATARVEPQEQDGIRYDAESETYVARHTIYSAARTEDEAKHALASAVALTARYWPIQVSRVESPPREQEQLRAQKDAAYAERDQLVAALSKLWPAHLARHPDADTAWENDWRWIVCIHSPVGQLTWHIHDSERDWFNHLEVRDGDWDGHATDEKYARLAILAAHESR